MTRLVVQASRMTAVHAPVLAARLRASSRRARRSDPARPRRVRRTRPHSAAARARVRPSVAFRDDAVVFGVFGGLTPEKRVPQVLDAFDALLPYAPDAHLLLAGRRGRTTTWPPTCSGAGSAPRHDHRLPRGRRELTDCIAACDVSLNLRWPTAREISGRGSAPSPPAGRPSPSISHIWPTCRRSIRGPGRSTWRAPADSAGRGARRSCRRRIVDRRSTSLDEDHSLASSPMRAARQRR